MVEGTTSQSIEFVDNGTEKNYSRVLKEDTENDTDNVDNSEVDNDENSEADKDENSEAV